MKGELIAKLRYMGRQYSAGQFARGGGQQKHYLEEAADELELLAQQRDELLAALCNFADWYDERSGDNECRPLENARAAIAKCKGGEA